MEPEESSNHQGTAEKEEQSLGIMLPDFKLYYKAVISLNFQ